MKKVDVTFGTEYGSLTFLQRTPSRKEVSGKIRGRALCICVCGNIREYDLDNLRGGNTKSCGCLKSAKSTKHGMHNSRPYHIWENMLSRTSNPNNPKYSYYGGSGIVVEDPSWRDFSVFWREVCKHYYLN